MIQRIDTYDGWKAQGRVVIKGQKAYLFDNEDIAYFKINQTTTYQDNISTKEKDIEDFVSILTRLFKS